MDLHGKHSVCYNGYKDYKNCPGEADSHHIIVTIVEYCVFLIFLLYRHKDHSQMVVGC